MFNALSDTFNGVTEFVNNVVTEVKNVFSGLVKLVRFFAKHREMFQAAVVTTVSVFAVYVTAFSVGYVVSFLLDAFVFMLLANMGLVTFTLTAMLVCALWTVACSAMYAY